MKCQGCGGGMMWWVEDGAWRQGCDTAGCPNVASPLALDTARMISESHRLREAERESSELRRILREL